MLTLSLQGIWERRSLLPADRAGLIPGGGLRPPACCPVPEYPPKVRESPTQSRSRISSPGKRIAHTSPFQNILSGAGILEQSMRAKNGVGIWLSYRPARLHRLAESIPELLLSLKIPSPLRLCLNTYSNSSFPVYPFIG